MKHFYLRKLFTERQTFEAETPHGVTSPEQADQAATEATTLKDIGSGAGETSRKMPRSDLGVTNGEPKSEPEQARSG